MKAVPGPADASAWIEYDHDGLAWLLTMTWKNPAKVEHRAAKYTTQAYAIAAEFGFPEFERVSRYRFRCETFAEIPELDRPPEPEPISWVAEVDAWPTMDGKPIGQPLPDGTNLHEHVHDFEPQPWEPHGDPHEQVGG